MQRDKDQVIRDSAILPVTSLNHDALADPEMSFWARHRIGLSVFAAVLVLCFIGSWIAMNSVRPFSDAINLNVLNQELLSIHTPEIEKTDNAAVVEKDPVKEPTKVSAQATKKSKRSAAKPSAVQTWRPDDDALFRSPQDSPPVSKSQATRVFVVTISAKVTAYTPYDHAVSHPQWADGVVAWHPRNRKRHVTDHPYCLATDWKQFPGGSTFIHVPGYMPKTFPSFPESFRVVDDKCGRARRDNRNGLQPVIDVRYLTRHSAISGRDAWGLKQLDVEVIFPADFKIPASLQRWIKAAEWRTYKDGKVIAKKVVY